MAESVADDMISSSREELREENMQLEDSFLDESRDRESEESRSSSDGDGQRNGSDDDHKHRRRNRHRRVKGGKRHHRKYRPYQFLSEEDKRKLAEKESLKAHLRRASLLASGHPLAPYNTTQYLIEEKIKNGQIAVPASPKSPQVQSSRPMTPSHPPCATPRHPGINEEEFPMQTPPALGVDDLYPELNPGTPSGSTTPSQSRYDEEFVENYESYIFDRFLTMSRTELLQTALGLQKQCDRMGQTLLQEQQKRRVLAKAMSAAAILEGTISNRSDDQAAATECDLEEGTIADVLESTDHDGSSNKCSRETAATRA